MYFRLNPECYFIKGECRSAIFDLIEGEIYALNEQDTGLVSSFEANNPVDVDNEFLIELKRLCLGNFYSRSVYIQKIRIGSPRSENQINIPPSLARGFIEMYVFSLPALRLAFGDCSVLSVPMLPVSS